MKQVCNKKILSKINEIYKNRDKIGKDQAYMLITYIASLNSLDPHTKTGACIVSKDDKIISIGWNAMPIEGNFPWDREGTEENTKYPYVIHAERWAIINATYDNKANELDNSAMYINLFPCNHCMQQIASYGISKLYYDSDKYHDMLFSKEARKIIKEYNNYRKEGFISKQINIDKELLEKELNNIKEKVGI